MQSDPMISAVLSWLVTLDIISPDEAQDVDPDLGIPHIDGDPQAFRDMFRDFYLQEHLPLADGNISLGAQVPLTEDDSIDFAPILATAPERFSAPIVPSILRLLAPWSDRANALLARHGAAPELITIRSAAQTNSQGRWVPSGRFGPRQPAARTRRYGALVLFFIVALSAALARYAASVACTSAPPSCVNPGAPWFFFGLVGLCVAVLAIDVAIWALFLRRGPPAA